MYLVNKNIFMMLLSKIDHSPTLNPSPEKLFGHLYFRSIIYTCLSVRTIAAGIINIFN